MLDDVGMNLIQVQRSQWILDGYNNMTESELKSLLSTSFPKENESCEWKEFKNLKNFFCGDEGNDIVSYVSGLSNMEGGALVVGVKDRSLDIVGTDTYNYSRDSAILRLTEKCVGLSSEGLEITEYITDDTKKKVWVINVPKHLPRRPVYAHEKAFQRKADSLVLITKERLDSILSEPLFEKDWTASIIKDASIDDLDPKAIAIARKKYKEVYPSKSQEVDSWDDTKFLNKAKITIKGSITVTAIILLGKEESEHFLSPAVCKIRWSLKNHTGQNLDFHIFSIPMLLAIEEVRKSIRNTTYEYTIQGSIFPEIMPRYDIFTIREPLNNAIAHQDYSKQARIEVIEYENEKLIFRNHGSFIPGSVEKVVLEDSPESVYRNPFLIEAMRNVHMIETEGGGIKKLFEQQQKRFFPCPEYDLRDNTVSVEIEGCVINESFARILANNPNLSLSDIILLDKVQKHKVIDDASIAYLRRRKFIEGRKNNLFLSEKVASSSQHVGLKSTYIKNRSFDDDYYKKLILEYLNKFGKASRKEIDDLLIDKLSDSLNEQQKFNKITNLLASLRKSGKLRLGEKRIWVLV